jgi:hypothetical protein
VTCLFQYVVLTSLISVELTIDIVEFPFKYIAWYNIRETPNLGVHYVSFNFASGTS